MKDRQPFSTSSLEGEVGPVASLPGRVGGGFPLTPRTVVGALLLTAAVVGLYFAPNADTAWTFAKEQLDTWQVWADAHFTLAVLAYLAVYVGILTLPIPLAAVVAMVGGAIFGPWRGTAVLSVGGITAATLSFVLARYLLYDWVERTFGHRLTRLKAGVARDGGLYVFALRWMPVIPFFVINMGLAVTPVPLRTYVLVSWPAMLPFAAAYAIAGSQIAGLESPRDAINPAFLVAVSAVAFVPLLLKWAVRRMLKGDAGAPA
jgi:uncharacterized membrane protein YdjX (TVP38/TMEM64 family)